MGHDKPGQSSGRPNGPSKRKFDPSGGRSARRTPERPPRLSGASDPMDRRRDSGDDISPSRLEAAKALYSIEKGAKTADVLEKPRGLKPEDEALLRELVYGCTRQKRLLDYYLNSLCQSPFDKLPIEIKITLRMGLYQLLFLDRVPARAAVHESVNLAKKGGQEALSGFVNAVLRNAENKKASLEIKGDSEIDTLALKYSHPTWLVKKWAEKMGQAQLEEILKADNQPHPVYLHVSPGLEEKVTSDLEKQNIKVSKEEWPPGTLRLRSHEGGLFTGESFQKGDWIVQDWVPQAMLRMLPLEAGQRAWDVCAAPGGKTVALAWKLGEKGQVLASDASEERRKRLAENIKRTALKQVMVYDGDIQKMPPAQKFDLIWVDAPCSGTGVLSRRADLRWRLIPKDVLCQVQPQKKLLEQSYGHLYPSGFLVYSTCSLEKEENQQVIQSFLSNHPEYKTLDFSLPDGHPEIIADEVGATFWPTADHDGGFLAILGWK
jgi:16S rRNA (cytosine967-C5)-methyltransferase